MSLICKRSLYIANSDCKNRWSFSAIEYCGSKRTLNGRDKLNTNINNFITNWFVGEMVFRDEFIVPIWIIHGCLIFCIGTNENLHRGGGG